MKETDFISEEYGFLQEVESSTLYQRMKELSAKMDAKPFLVEAARRRDEDYAQAAKESDPEKKRLLLLDAKKEQDILMADEDVQEYLLRYRALEKILAEASSLLKEVA